MRIETLDKYGIPVVVILALLVGLILGINFANSIRAETTTLPTCTNTTIDKYLECQ